MARPTLNELMGKAGSKPKEDLSLNDLEDLLGEKLPRLEFSPVGRLRLTSALRMRFGEGYKNLPGIDNILKEFDAEAAFNVKKMEMRQIKSKR